MDPVKYFDRIQGDNYFKDDFELRVSTDFDFKSREKLVTVEEQIREQMKTIRYINDSDIETAYNMYLNAVKHIESRVKTVYSNVFGLKLSWMRYHDPALSNCFDITWKEMSLSVRIVVYEDFSREMLSIINKFVDTKISPTL